MHLVANPRPRVPRAVRPHRAHALAVPLPGMPVPVVRVAVGILKSPRALRDPLPVFLHVGTRVHADALPLLHILPGGHVGSQHCELLTNSNQLKTGPGRLVFLADSNRAAYLIAAPRRPGAEAPVRGSAWTRLRAARSGTRCGPPASRRCARIAWRA